MTSTHSSLKRTIKEHEKLAFKDRQRWMKQREEIQLQRENESQKVETYSSSGSGSRKLEPPLELLIGERNLEEVLEMMVSFSISFCV